MYDRRIGDEELNFEASGALEQASLVMRDRETDSWWSLMQSRSIGGTLEGIRLRELSVGKKTTWGEWKVEHPRTVVLSIDGAEHVEDNPYQNYLTGDGTFRGLEVEDDRLEPKEPIFAFWWGDRAHAIALSVIEGGHVQRVDDATFFFHRPRGSAIHRSSVAWVLPEDFDARDELLGGLERRLSSGEIAGAEMLEGFDTYWYTWVAVNRGTMLLVP